MYCVPSLHDAFHSSIPAAIVYPVSHAAGMSVIRALAGHCPIVAVDHKPNAAGLRSRHVVPYLAPVMRQGGGGFAEWMPLFGERFRERPVLFLVDDDDVFMSLQETDLRFTDYFHLPSSGWDIVEPMVDKEKLYVNAVGAGFNMPHRWSSIDGVEQFPCLVKPTYSTAFRARFGVKAIPCEDRGNLTDAVRDVEAAGIPYMIQEYIPGPTDQLYTFAAYSGEGGYVYASFTGRKLHQWPEEFGTARLTESVYYPELEALGANLLRHWGYRGISLTEFKRDIEGQLRLIETNVRPGGWPERLAQSCGPNLVLAAYNDTIGWPVVRRNTLRIGMKWANLPEDFYHNVHGVRSFLRWLRVIRGLAVDAFWSWRDPMPFFVRLRGFVRQVRDDHG